MTVAERVNAAGARLTAAGIEAGEARASAVALAQFALAVDRAGLLARMREPADPDFLRRFDAAIGRRAGREPVAYITGEREFWGRSFHVTRDVLIPRPETELIVEAALERTEGDGAFLDAGTGSGCLAVTIAAERPEARMVATDVSSAALAVAQANARRHRVDDRVTFVCGDLLAGQRGPFDLIVSNPPYVPASDRGRLLPEVETFEPSAALFSGPDGLDVIRALVPASLRALRPGGRLLLEIGAGQVDAVRALLDAAQFTDVRVIADLQAIPRVLSARRPMA